MFFVSLTGDGALGWGGRYEVGRGGMDLGGVAAVDRGCAMRPRDALQRLWRNGGPSTLIWTDLPDL